MRHKQASSPKNAPCPGEFARQNRKSNRDYDHGRARQHDHDSAEKEHGKPDHRYDYFADNRGAIETKTAG
jgi:hypothetical protein